MKSNGLVNSNGIRRSISPSRGIGHLYSSPTPVPTMSLMTTGSLHHLHPSSYQHHSNSAAPHSPSYHHAHSSTSYDYHHHQPPNVYTPSALSSSLRSRSSVAAPVIGSHNVSPRLKPRIYRDITATPSNKSKYLAIKKLCEIESTQRRNQEEADEQRRQQRQLLLVTDEVVEEIQTDDDHVSKGDINRAASGGDICEKKLSLLTKGGEDDNDTEEEEVEEENSQDEEDEDEEDEQEEENEEQEEQVDYDKETVSQFVSKSETEAEECIANDTRSAAAKVVTSDEDEGEEEDNDRIEHEKVKKDVADADSSCYKKVDRPKNNNSDEDDDEDEEDEEEQEEEKESITSNSCSKSNSIECNILGSHQNSVNERQEDSGEETQATDDEGKEEANNEEEGKLVATAADGFDNNNIYKPAFARNASSTSCSKQDQPNNWSSFRRTSNASTCSSSSVSISSSTSPSSSLSVNVNKSAPAKQSNFLDSIELGVSDYHHRFGEADNSNLNINSINADIMHIKQNNERLSPRIIRRSINHRTGGSESATNSRLSLNQSEVSSSENASESEDGEIKSEINLSVPSRSSEYSSRVLRCASAEPYSSSDRRSSSTSTTSSSSGSSANECINVVLRCPTSNTRNSKNRFSLPPNSNIFYRPSTFDFENLPEAEDENEEEDESSTTVTIRLTSANSNYSETVTTCDSIHNEEEDTYSCYSDASCEHQVATSLAKNHQSSHVIDDEGEKEINRAITSIENEMTSLKESSTNLIHPRASSSSSISNIAVKAASLPPPELKTSPTLTADSLQNNKERSYGTSVTAVTAPWPEKKALIEKCKLELSAFISKCRDIDEMIGPTSPISPTYVSVLRRSRQLDSLSEEPEEEDEDEWADADNAHPFAVDASHVKVHHSQPMRSTVISERRRR